MPSPSELLLVPGPTLDDLAAELRPWLDRRVQAHERRRTGRTDVPTYLSELRIVREAEARIEEQRRALGARTSLAFEISKPEVIARGWSVLHGWRRA